MITNLLQHLCVRTAPWSIPHNGAKQSLCHISIGIRRHESLDYKQTWLSSLRWIVFLCGIAVHWNSSIRDKILPAYTVQYTTKTRKQGTFTHKTRKLFIAGNNRRFSVTQLMIRIQVLVQSTDPWKLNACVETFLPLRTEKNRDSSRFFYSHVLVLWPYTDLKLCN
jgi:hypothetical protein